MGAAFFTVDQLWASIVAACLVQLSSVIDGCDGEVARLRHLATSRGAWVDTMLDRYADTAIVMAITLGYTAGHPGVLPWLGGLAASTGFLLASYATKEFALTHGVPYPDNVLNRLKRRDLRLLVMCCGGLAGYPFYAMLVMGLLTHGLIVGILVNGWRFRSPDARPALVPRFRWAVSSSLAVSPSQTVEKQLMVDQITESQDRASG